MTLRLRHNVTLRGPEDAPVMLFAHGFGCDQSMWRFVAPAFEATHRVVLFDHAGCGGADPVAYDVTRHGSLEGYAEDVLAICADLELRDVVYVGHSVSAMIGLLASIREPGRFSRLLLIGPSPRYLNDPPAYTGGFERRDLEGLLDLMESNYVGWANFLAPLVMGNAERPELSEELQASFCKTDPFAARRFAEVTFLGDNRADLGKVTRPTLIVQCARDAIAPREVGAFMHKALGESTYRELDASGHCPHMSHPTETIDVIRGYLGQG
jgi:sigma-B regulation protein RsbQ